MADTYPSILHIENADLSNLGSLQIGVMAGNDADLGFRLWGGKDSVGDVTHWLAKDEIARVQSLYILDLDVLDSAGIVKYDSDGLLAGAGELDNLADVVITTPLVNEALIYNGSNWVNDATTGTGDVVGPASATDEAIAIFDGTTGKLIKNSPMRINDVAGIHRIQILEPTAAAWKDALQIQDIAANGLPGGEYVLLGNTDNPLLFHTDADPWLNDGTDNGRVLWEKIKSDWILYRRGTIEADIADTAPPFTITTAGTNGGSVNTYVGDRTPVGNVTAAPGSVYHRVGGTSTRLYQHRGSASNNTDWVEFGVLPVTANDVTIQKVGVTTTIINVQDTINQFGLAGSSEDGVDYISGATSTTIDIAAGQGFLRSTDSNTGELFSISWLAVAGASVPVNTVRYVGVEYNSGTPQAVVRLSENWNLRSEFPLGSVVNQGGTALHIRHGVQWASSFGSRIYERLYETLPLARAERVGGLIPSGSGRYMLMSAGELYDGFTGYDIASFDSTGADRFDVYYRDGVGGWIGVAAQAQWDNAYWDDGTGTLNTVTNNRYSVHWLYLETDGNIVLLYGRGDYVTQAAAENEAPPDPIPDRVTAHGRLLGRVLFQEGGSAATTIVNVWTSVFVGSAGTGDFYGPAGATDEAIVIFDGATGKLGKDSPIRIQDTTGPDAHQIQIQNPLTPFAWTDAIQIQDIAANGVPGGEYVIVGDVDNPLLFRSDVDPWLTDATNSGRVLWERIKSDWTLYRRGTISGAIADTASILTLETTSTNGESVNIYIGDRTPVGNVTAAPGSLYHRVSGTGTRLYQHRGSSSDNTNWVEFEAGGSGSPYTHGSVTNTAMLAISTPSAGDTCYNTTHDMMFWWTGNTWQCQDTFEAENNSGTTLYVGDPVTGSSIVAGRVTTTATTAHPNIIGVSIVEVASGAYCSIAEKGVWDTWVYGVVSIGDMIENLGAGLARSTGGQPNYSPGQFATAMASQAGSTSSSVKPCKIGFAGQPS